MTYRSKVTVFVLTVITALLLLPVFNFYRAEDDLKISREALFNIDYFIPFVQKKLLPMGLSLDPDQVIIGKDGWLYLGDQYKGNISARRHGLSFEEEERAKTLQLGLALWDEYLKSEGVKLFQVMMGPDKASIYPEYLPDWAKPSGPTRTDALLSGEHSNLITDIKSPLVEAKDDYDRPLYYKTDTHWNSIGAWAAFSAFLNELSVNKGLIQGQWLTNDQVSISSITPKDRGDLSNFLRLRIPDEMPVITLGKEINVTRVDYNTGEIRGDRGNPDVSPPSSPLLFKNPEALNSTKVLWLRDSFGGPVTPYMSATFSEVLQIHYIYVNSATLIDIVKSFKPEYVFITTVERELLDLNIGLTDLPLQSNNENGNPTFTETIETVHSVLNDIEIYGNKYTVTDTEDPFIVFDLQKPVEATPKSKVAFNLQCEDGSEELGLQLFWLKIGDSNFSEANSIRFSTRTGDVEVNLGNNTDWLAAERVGRLRVDFNSPGRCGQFNLSEPTVEF